MCLAGVLMGFVFAAAAAAQAVPDDITARIKKEATTGSQVADDVFRLTDAIGPRSTGSLSLHAAERWLVERLREYGLQHVRVEGNPPMDVGDGLLLEPPGWSSSRLTVQQLSPWQDTLIAVPLLYSPPTPGVVTGGLVVAPLPGPSAADIASFKDRYRGHLRGKFMLSSDKELRIPPATGPSFHRYTAEELREMSNASPSVPPPAPQSSTNQPQRTPPRVQDMLDQQSLLFDFLRDEGVLGVVGAARGEGGTLALRPPPAPPKLISAPPPTFDLAPEHFNRLLRLALRDVPVRLEVRLDSQFHEPAGTENVLGEIPGGDKTDEIVLVGAHVDSWHVGTGATDNAAGVAAVLEAVRILTTLKVPLRRTVRIAFWGGEELGRLGSRGYVARYLIGPTGTRLPEYDKLSGYLNIDYGSGRIRGVYLQGNAPLKPLLEPWLSGLGDGGLVVTLRSTLGSDQASFERVGIPGLSFIQDPLNYEQRTHHTNMDHADYVLTDDVTDSAATIAALIYRVANAPAMLPRKAAQ
jgi:hypothetical protein